MRLVGGVSNFTRGCSVSILTSIRAASLELVTRGASSEVRICSRRVSTVPINHKVNAVLPRTMGTANTINMVLGRTRYGLALSRIHRTVGHTSRINLTAVIYTSARRRVGTVTRVGPGVLITRPDRLVNANVTINHRCISTYVSLMGDVGPRVLILPSTNVDYNRSYCGVVVTNTSTSNSSDNVYGTTSPTTVTRRVVTTIHGTFSRQKWVVGCLLNTSVNAASLGTTIFSRGNGVVGSIAGSCALVISNSYIRFPTSSCFGLFGRTCSRLARNCRVTTLSISARYRAVVLTSRGKGRLYGTII